MDCGKRPRDCTCVTVPPCIRVYWLFSYKGDTARAIIYSLKQLRSLPDFAYFARRLYEQILHISGNGMSFDCVCYVPRNKEGIAWFGYDHSRLLALQLAELFSIPCMPLIEHTGVSGEQKRLSRAFRGVAAKTRFRANQAELYDGKYRYKRVLLVDDLVTTGNTMGECARILKNHGVKQIFGAFVAHTPSGDKRGMYF